MTEFAEFVGEHVRLTVLRLLESQAGYQANDSVMLQATQAMGLNVTRAQLRGHVEWLGEQRLVTLMRPTADLIVATLTERGFDVANGRSWYTGVARPSPKG